MKRKRGWEVVLAVAILAGLAGFGLVSYIISGRSANTASQVQVTSDAAAAKVPANANTQPAATPAPQPQQGEHESLITLLLGGEQSIPGQVRTESWRVIMLRIIVRLLLATLLATMLAFRPRKSAFMQRNIYVAQTQILLAVVASALMMIVGDNAARAFGIFAAVSVVRFRTNIRDPKEVTVLLISLSLGLATGVGRWDLAIVLTLFVVSLLWLLESKEPEQVFRSMELTVRTRDPESMQHILKRIFVRHGFNAELREIDPPDEDDPVGCVMYSVNMSLNVSTDQISEEIRAFDAENIEGIEWQPKKEGGYIYQ